MNLDDVMVDPAKLAGVVWDFQTKAPCAGNQPHPQHICFKIVPQGAAFDSLMQELLEPFLLERRRGQVIPAEVVRKLRAQAHAKVTVTAWWNLDMGKPLVAVPHSEAKVLELLTDPKWELVRRFVESAFANETALLFEAEREAVPN